MRLLLLPLLLCLLFVSGCAPHLARWQGPALQSRLIGIVDAGSPVALDPSGTRCAYVAGDKLHRLDVATGREEELAEGKPTLLLWSTARPLAALFPSGEVTKLLLFGDNGEIGRMEIPGAVRAGVWKGDGELLLLAEDVDAYSFGSSYRLSLHRWKSGLMESVVLHDGPLRRKAAAALAEGKFPLALALSPLQDEIAYTRLHDPPLFQPHRKVFVLNLRSGKEHPAGILEPEEKDILYAADPDVLVAAGGGVLRPLSAWETPPAVALPADGLAGDTVYRRGKPFMTFPSETSAAASADGSSLLLRQGEDLFLVTGVPAAKPATAAQERLLELRSWRSSGLVSPEDFRREAAGKTQP